MSFLTGVQRKYLVANKRDIEEFPICKIFVIDTSFFHKKGESFVTRDPEPKVM
jgi:hypothetical protein